MVCFEVFHRGPYPFSSLCRECNLGERPLDAAIKLCFGPLRSPLAATAAIVLGLISFLLQSAEAPRYAQLQSLALGLAQLLICGETARSPALPRSSA